MKLPRRPELKLSQLKVPAVVQDLYWDLRDRRLLPLVALLIVAIVAVPFLLGGGGDSDGPVPAPRPIGSGAETASLSVVPADPGLREPGKRLAGRPAKNPFRQQYTGPVFNAGGAPIAETSTSGSESGSVEVPTETSSGSASPESSAPASTPTQPSSPAQSPVEPAEGGDGRNEGSGSPQPEEIQLYSFAIDLRVAHAEATKSGERKMGEPTTLREVEPSSPVPDKNAPVLTYLGVDSEAKKALMLVSLEATSLLGDNECVSGSSVCQIIALEPKSAEVVEFGEAGTRYKFELLDIEPVKGAKIKAP